MVDFNVGGSWAFNQLSSPGLTNLGTPNVVYFDTGSGQFTYAVAPSGTFNPADNFNFSGIDQFTGSFTVNTPNAISIQASGGGNNVLVESIDANATIQANAAGQQVQLFGDGLNLVAANNANFNSTSGNIVISSNTTQITGNNSLNMNTVSGNISINSNSGDIGIQAGTGPSVGNLNMSAGTTSNFNLNAPDGGGNINAKNDINVSSSTGGATINSAAANISAGATAIAMGVSAGSGMTVDAVTGNFQFGASAGSFLLGTLGSTVTILGHLGVMITSDAGDVEITGATAIKLILPTPAGANNTPLLIDTDGTIHV